MINVSFSKLLQCSSLCRNYIIKTIPMMNIPCSCLYQIFFIFLRTHQFIRLKHFSIRMNLKGKVIKASGKQYILKDQLTEGGFSIIYTTKNPNVICKVQVLDIPEVSKAFQKEKNIMKAINHPNIVRLHDWNQLKDKDGNHGFLFMENCSEGTIFNILEKSQGSLPQKTILQIFQAVSSAIQQIHRNGIAHRDIKLQNMIVNKKGQYKLCDFGSCSKEIIRMINNCNRVDIEEYIEKTTTPLYRCPEQLDLYSGFEIGPKVDIFAMGVLIFMLCFKKQPFESRLSAINKQYFVPQYNPYSQQLLKIIEQCFTCDPDLRPTATQVKNKVKNLQKRKKALVEINLVKQFEASFEELVKVKNSNLSSLKEGKQQQGNGEGLINKIKKMYNQFTTQTEGWFVGFIEDSEDAPMLKYSRSIISKCWEKRYKIDKVYQILSKYWEENKSKCLVVLKLLIFLHNFLRKGPSEALNYEKQNNPIRLATKIYNHWKISQKHISKQDPKRSMLIYSMIKYYCLIIIDKSKFAYQNSHLIQGNYSIIPYFSQKDQTMILKLPILQSMVQLLHKCVQFHEIIQKDDQSTTGKQIARSILWSIADQQYCLISSFAFLFCAFKDALNYVRQDLSMDKIRQKVNQLQESFRKSFEKLIILMEKTKGKTKQFFTAMESQGLTLNENVIKQIESIQFSNQKLSDFKITKHLNYQNSIGGLKLPFTYEEVVKNPAILSTASKKQSLIIDTIDVNQFKISQNQRILIKQQSINIEKGITIDQQVKPNINQKNVTNFTNIPDKQIHKKDSRSQTQKQKENSGNLMQFSHQNLNSDFFNPNTKIKKQSEIVFGNQFFSVPSKPSNIDKNTSQFDNFINFATLQQECSKQQQNYKQQRLKIKQKLIKSYDASKGIYENFDPDKKADQVKQMQQQTNRKDKIHEKQNINQYISPKSQKKQYQHKGQEKVFQQCNQKNQKQLQKSNQRMKTRRFKKAQRAALRKQKRCVEIALSKEEQKQLKK